jgi:uncharacterized protein involved in exopolysaccharide biosynthesis
MEEFEKNYQDMEGNACTLYSMIRNYPEWAASRIREGEKAIACAAIKDKEIEYRKQEYLDAAELVATLYEAVTKNSGAPQVGVVEDVVNRIAELEAEIKDRAETEGSLLVELVKCNAKIAELEERLATADILLMRDAIALRDAVVNEAKIETLEKEIAELEAALKERG